MILIVFVNFAFYNFMIASMSSSSMVMHKSPIFSFKKFNRYAGHKY